MYIGLRRIEDWREAASSRFRVLREMLRWAFKQNLFTVTKVSVWKDAPGEELGGTLVGKFDNFDERLEDLVIRTANSIVDVEGVFEVDGKKTIAHGVAINEPELRLIYGDVYFNTYKTEGRMFPDYFWGNGRRELLVEWVNHLINLDRIVRIDVGEDISVRAFPAIALLIYRKNENKLIGEVVSIAQKSNEAWRRTEYRELGAEPEDFRNIRFKTRPYSIPFLTRRLEKTKFKENFFRFAEEVAKVERKNSVLLISDSKENMARLFFSAAKTLDKIFAELPPPEDIEERIDKSAEKAEIEEYKLRKQSSLDLF